MSETPRLRSDLPFRRIALVLSGGGALGAYEVGVFRAMERLGLKPGVIAGVSVGAINAVVWVAHGFDSEALRRTWNRLRPSGLGIRWTTLAARAVGAFIVALGLFEALIAVVSMEPLRLLMRSRLPIRPLHFETQSLTLEVLAWALVAGLGVAVIVFSRQVEDLLVRFARPHDPARAHRWLGRTLLILAALYVVTAPFNLPWPRRFHTTALGALGLVWVMTRRSPTEGSLRRLMLRLLPDTGGRGLWRSSARRRLLADLIGEGDASRLFSSDVHLIISACAVDTGRMHYFVNWPKPSDTFLEGVRQSFGEVTPLRNLDELMDAAVASSAVPVVFEPGRIGGRDFLDGGVFSNQPLHAVLADGADALVLVLVSPSDSPPRLTEDSTLIEVAARLPQLANWRDLQAELRGLPSEWSRDGDPARVCVVEPAETLPGSLLAFDPVNAMELMSSGESDACRALVRAGWIVAEQAGPTEALAPA